MKITLDESAGHVLVRARGRLSVRTATGLRDALLKAAAEQTRGVVCDLRDCSAADASLTILHVVADQVADWPGTPVVLVADGPALQARLARLGLDRRFVVVADPVHAVAALRQAPGFLHAATTLPPTQDAPAVARAFVTRMLTLWRAEGALDAARWVVSELVTNAVSHAGTDVTVRASLAGGRVLLAVADRGPGGIPARGESRADRGWGLTVVEQLARTRWGVLPRMGEGVVVWAVVDAAQGSAGRVVRLVPRQPSRT